MLEAGGQQQQDPQVQREVSRSQVNDDSEDTIGASWDDKTRAYVQKLRNESKQRRLENQQLQERLAKAEGSYEGLRGAISQAVGVPQEEVKPEDVIRNLQSDVETYQNRLQFLEGCLDLGLTSKDQRDYFEFLLNKHMGEREEGYEASDEDIETLVQKVRLHMSAGAQGPRSTSFAQGVAPTPGNNPGEVSVEQFRKMGTIERGQLYGRSPELYQKLMSQI